MGTYVELLSNLVQTFILTWFISTFFGFKYDGLIKGIAFLSVWIITFVELTLVNRLIVYEGIIAGISIITLIVYAKIFLKSSFLAHSFLVFFSYAIVFSASSIILFLFSYLSGNNIESLILDFNIWRIAMILLIRSVEYIIFSFIIKVNDKYILTKKEWVLFISMPLMTWIAVTLMTNAAIISEEILSYMFYIAVIMVFINIITYYFMLKIKHDSNTKLEYELLKMQHENIKSTESNMKALFESVYSLKHDLDKHLFAVKDMAERNDCKEIEKYISGIIEHSTESVQKVIFTDNDVFNAIINTKLAICKQKKITTTVSIDNEAVSYLQNECITVIFGNLLDNAIEAAEKTTQRVLSLVVTLKRQYISICVENSFNEEYSDITLETTKKNKTGHGFGTKNVRRVVDEYDGMYQHFLGDTGRFCCHILLPKGSINAKTKK